MSYRYIRAGVSDKDMRQLNRPISREAINRLVFKYIRQLVKGKSGYDRELLKEIGDSYSLMTEAYDLLGEKKILETGFKDADLKAAVEAKKTSNLERSAGVVAAVHNKFKEGQWYSRTEINTGLQEIYRLFKIQYNKRGISGNICIYYVAKQSECKKKRGYLLKSKITAL